MDILGGMSNTNEGQQVYLAFKTAEQKFFVNGETPIEFQYLQLDPATFRSGWGAYRAATGFDFHWDDKFGVLNDKPDDDYKRAFSAWVLPQGHPHPLLWQRFTYAESSAFNSILGTFWNEKDAHPNQMPVVKYVGSKAIQVGMGKSSELTFEFAKFAERANEFILPAWADNDGTIKKDQDTGNSSVSEEDIPF